MSELQINSSIQDVDSGSFLGGSFKAETDPSDVQRVRAKVSSGETSILITIPIAPCILVIANGGLVTPTDNPASVIRWGYAAGNLPNEVRIGESFTLRIVSAPTAIFWQSTISDLWGEFQLFADS